MNPVQNLHSRLAEIPAPDVGSTEKYLCRRINLAVHVLKILARNLPAILAILCLAVLK
jgi:hypothetical protein